MDKVFAVENRVTRERVNGFYGLLSDFGNERLTSIPSGLNISFSDTTYLVFSERDAKRLVNVLDDGFEAVETERMEPEYTFDFPETDFSVYLSHVSYSGYPKFVGGAARLGQIVLMLNSLSGIVSNPKETVFNVISGS